MANQPEFDLQAAHRYFSAQCFNQAWELIDKPSRTPAEDEQMIRLSMCSHWHWTQRQDVTADNLSVGYWQTSRIYALLGQVEQARHYAQLCLEASQGEGVLPFALGYAYEALARAAMIAGDQQRMEQYLAEARRVSERMVDAEAKKMLLDDLTTIG
jgi:tetratricopeptide (TPR) repeat protein